MGPLIVVESPNFARTSTVALLVLLCVTLRRSMDRVSGGQLQLPSSHSHHCQTSWMVPSLIFIIF